MRLSRPAALKTVPVKADREREAGMSNGNTRSAGDGSERYEICP
jgi:hypothetical protein